MKDGDLDRLIEALALGESVEPADRQAVDAALQRDDDVAERMRDGFRFEAAMTRVLDMPPFEDDVASKVLERVSRRSSQYLRRPLTDGLASHLLKDALDSGKIRADGRRRRRFLPTARQLGRMAAMFLVAWAAWIWFNRDVKPFGRFGESRSALESAIAQVVFLDPERLVAMPDLPVQDRGDLVADGEEITTSAQEGAFLSLTGGPAGRVAVMPSSRVVVTRGPKAGTVRLRLIQGSVKIAGNGRRPVFVQGEGGTDAEVTGEAELSVVSAGYLPSRSGAPIGALLARAEKRGQVAFRNPDLHLNGGEVGLGTRESAIRLPSKPDAVVTDAARDWRPSAGMPGGATPLAKIGGDTFTRELLVREAIRVYADELFDLIIKSAVVQFEINDAKIELSADQKREAADLIDTHPYFVVAPLRSAEAQDERALQVAGMLAIARLGGQRQFDREMAIAEMDRVWERLAAKLKVEWGLADRGSALRFAYKNHFVDITVSQAWSDLQRFMRAAEVEVFLRDFAERHVVRRWIEGLGAAWPDFDGGRGLDPMRRAALGAAVRLEGLTWRQFQNRAAVNTVVIGHLPEIRAAEIDRAMARPEMRPRQVVCEHHFFPFTEASQGLPSTDSVGARVTALKAALAVIDQRRRGEVPATVSRPDRVFRGLPRTGVESGPRSWWTDVYGPEFEDVVAALPEGHVSEPIVGREGCHVVYVAKITDLALDAGRARAAATMRLTAEAVRRHIAKLVDQARPELPTAAEFLDRR